MSHPVLLAVVEDPDSLERVASQLVGRYDRHYRVECLATRDDAARVLTELAAAEEAVALVLVSSALRGDLLEQARQLHPYAKRALLVSPGVWANPETADAIRAAMALGQVDHYVLEPADRDEVFHDAISSFLLEWARERRLVPQTVHIVAEKWSGRAHVLREVFEHCSVPHAFWLASSNRGAELIARAGGDAKLPLMVLPDGTALGDPSDAEIAEAAGAPAAIEDDTYELVIVGAGPAGLSAAVYCASEGLHVLVVDAGGIGGQARSSSLIRNYLGFAKGVSGSRLAEQAFEQASLFGASFLFMHRVVACERTGDWLMLQLVDGRSVRARAVILATGADYRRLGVPSLDALIGAGVFYGGSLSEAPALQGKDVYVAGGGNAAGQAALHLARYARRVVLVVRARSLDAGMSHYLVRMVEAAPNVDVLTGTAVAGGGGAGHLEELVLRRAATGEETAVPADALFVLIGARPRTEWLPPELARDEHGFLLTGDDVARECWPLERAPLSLETSVPGVLAAGDVRHGSVKRVAAAVGEGATAAQLVHRLFAEPLSRPG